jgi:hypothetical protein
VKADVRFTPNSCRGLLVADASAKGHLADVRRCHFDGRREYSLFGQDDGLRQRIAQTSFVFHPFPFEPPIGIGGDQQIRPLVQACWVNPSPNTAAVPASLTH